MKVGLFFGSFNPIHIGHLVIANYMAENTDLDSVWLVVSPHNPLKDQRSLLHGPDRLEMVRLAIGDHDKLQACDVEFTLPLPSFTVDTLAYMEEKWPAHQWVLIMGSDTVNTLPKWKNHEVLTRRYDVYAYPRAKVELAYRFPRLHQLPTPIMEISASFIRQSLAQGKSVRYFVPDAVLAHIYKWGYYGA
ncbi:MAG: nicotinate-nucleotide adenylyltransferase [Bacteroidetes bacterium]|nr:nicotinate-nucleotide adenylyltransferase [Bacteroidota bacterium]